MKKIILLSLLLTSTSSFAWGNWDILDVQRHYAVNSQDVAKVLNLYPQVLANTDYTPSDIDFVNVLDINFAYVGETICEEGDERLTKRELSYMACPKASSINCIVKLTNLLDRTDPCLK